MIQMRPSAPAAIPVQLTASTDGSTAIVEWPDAPKRCRLHALAWPAMSAYKLPATPAVAAIGAPDAGVKSTNAPSVDTRTKPFGDGAEMPTPPLVVPTQIAPSGPAAIALVCRQKWLFVLAVSHC